MSDEEIKEESEDIEPERELSNIRPSKVSIVALGGNGEVFYVVKSADGEEQMTQKEFALEFFKSVLARNNAVIETLKQAEIEDGQETPEIYKASVRVIRDQFIGGQVAIQPVDDNVMKISGVVRDKSISLMEGAASQLEGVIAKIESSEDDFLPDISDDMAVLQLSFSSAVVAVESAVWTTAYVNDLPDSAFLYIGPGGKKDSDGKTTPRSLRKFPYRDENGKVDLPHLRNAVARIPQSSLSQNLKDQLQARARRLLDEKTSKSVLTEDVTMTETTETTEITEIESVKALTETIMKSAKKDDDVSVEVIQKQARMASDVLSEVMTSLAIDPSELEGLDMWDIRYKIGESVSLLMDAAKLDTMLGASSVEKSAPKEEPKEDNETMSTEEKKSKSAGSESSNDVTSSVEAPQSSTSGDITSTIAGAIKEALGPISEKIDKLDSRLESTEQIVEKMDRARVEAKGGEPVETVQKGTGENQPESTFASIMPEHLTGKFRHGERVKD